MSRCVVLTRYCLIYLTRLKVASFDAVVKVDDEQTWLEKLQNAGANTASPDRKTRMINDVIKGAAPVSSDAALSTTAEEVSSTATMSKPATSKDVNPAHLANFFNNLLTRSEKERKKDGSAKIRKLAKQELGNMK